MHFKSRASGAGSVIRIVMPGIRDVLTQADMVEFRNARSSVILMIPIWSNYPKAALEKLQTLAADFAAQNIEVFTVTEDDPSRNRPFTAWIDEQDKGPLRLFPMI